LITINRVVFRSNEISWFQWMTPNTYTTTSLLFSMKAIQETLRFTTADFIIHCKWSLKDNETTSIAMSITCVLILLYLNRWPVYYCHARKLYRKIKFRTQSKFQFFHKWCSVYFQWTLGLNSTMHLVSNFLTLSHTVTDRILNSNRLKLLLFWLKGDIRVTTHPD